MDSKAENSANTDENANNSGKQNNLCKIGLILRHQKATEQPGPATKNNSITASPQYGEKFTQ